MRFDGSISCCLKVEMLGLKSDMALSHRSLFRDLVVQSLPSAIGPNIQYNPPQLLRAADDMVVVDVHRIKQISDQVFLSDIQTTLPPAVPKVLLPLTTGTS